MTTQSEPRTFSEAEMLAIITDRVATETASLSENVATLTASKAELETKLDVALGEKAAAEKAAADAVKAFEDHKNAELEKAAAAAKKDERLAALKTAAAHLPETFLADEARIARVVAMSDDDFAGYVADMAASNVAPAAPVADAPKETAMTGSTVTPPAATDEPVSALKSFLLPGLNTEGGK